MVYYAVPNYAIYSRRYILFMNQVIYLKENKSIPHILVQFIQSRAVFTIQF